MKKIIILALLFAMPVEALAESAQDTIDKVILSYNWKPGTEARVIFSSDQIKSRNGKRTNMKMSGESTMKTVKHKKGLLIDFTYSKIDINADEKQMEGRMKKLMEKISAISPSYIINKDGEILDVIGLEEMRQTALKEMDKWFADADPKVKAQISNMLQSMLSNAQLMAQVQQDWNRDVGQWLGAEFEAGYVYSLDYETPIPMIGNAMIPFKGEYSYIGKTACNNKDKREKCVKLNYRSNIDSEGARIFITKMFEKMGAPKGEAEKITMTIDYELELITDPTTLYPYNIKEVKTVRVPALEGQPSSEQVDIKNYNYIYKRIK